MAGPLSEYVERIKIKPISSSSLSRVIKIENLHPSVVNGIRRSVISDTPSMAIEHVLIRANSSVIPDEMLAHRLALVPLLADPEEYDYLADLSREEAPKFGAVCGSMSDRNSIFLWMSVENRGKGVMHVYSEQIHVVDKNSFDRDLHGDTSEPRGVGDEAVTRGVLVGKLAPGQKIEAKMVAVKGSGKVHAKWNPTSLCSYRFGTEITIKDNRFTEAEIRSARKYFRGSGFQAGRDSLEIDPDSVIVNQDIAASEFRDRICVTRQARAFVFEIESLGLDPGVLLKRGVALLSARAEALRRSLASE